MSTYPMPSERLKFSYPAGKTSHIMVVDNCFSTEIARRLVEECKSSFNLLFSPGPTMGGVNPAVKCSMDFSFHPDAAAAAGLDPTFFATADREIHDGLARALALYRDEYSTLWGWPGISDTGFRLQMYAKNLGFYRTHTDGEPWSQTTRSSDTVRVMAAIIYLNKVVEGGETYFPEHNVMVDCVPGRIVLFPTSWTHPHGGRTPLSSEKWMISTFFTSLSPEAMKALENQQNDKLPEVEILGGDNVSA